jgi:UDP-hydrolysing UDP-N-acetyl-D-glucosamine 2-epimerase
MVRIAVVVTARPSWAKLLTLCEALRANPEVELQIIACASALLERYGKVVDVIKSQGFRIAAECWSVVEGERLLTSALETGALIAQLSPVLSRLSPDVVVVCADRHEVLAAAQAAAYSHIPLAHLQGGERSGSLDDRVRDSITALADYHFTCTELAKFRVVSLTGAYDRVFNVGCPSIDLAKLAQLEPPVTAVELGGAGAPIDPSQPFLLVLQHPVTSEAESAYEQMRIVLHEAAMCDLPSVVMWPGQDAGAAGASKAIREMQAVAGEPFHTVRNLPPNRFLKLLTQCSVLVGNSSAGIREASYLGVPVVNIGSRQFGRQRGPNVVDVPHDAAQIAQAIAKQIAHGPYPSSGLYGDGHSGQRIAEILANVCTRTDTCASR